MKRQTVTSMLEPFLDRLENCLSATMYWKTIHQRTMQITADRLQRNITNGNL
jgi:hypothetical protein